MTKPDSRPYLMRLAMLYHDLNLFHLVVALIHHTQNIDILLPVDTNTVEFRSNATYQAFFSRLKD